MAIFMQRKLRVCDDLKEINWIKNLSKNKPHIKIGILNIMPNLEDTEKDLLRVLDMPYIQVEIVFLYLKDFTKDRDKKKYLETYYQEFNNMKDEYFDGLIITGAPLEHFSNEDIHYQESLNLFIEYMNTHSKTILSLCWASEYLIEYLYGIKKHKLPNKLSGLYKHYIVNKREIIKGFDEYFLVPQSRYCGLNEEEILLNKELVLISKSNESGVFIVSSKDNKYLFVTGHLEYEKNTLDKEYLRDLNLKIRTLKPLNYYDELGRIHDNWRAHATLLYHNWLMYYVLK